MCLRARYIRVVGIDDRTYGGDRISHCRIREICLTAKRSGELNDIIDNIDERVENICQRVLNPLYIQALNGRLVDQTDYDTRIINDSLNVGGIIGTGPLIKFGIGQKVVNLFMKDLWALGLINNETSKLLHAPLDRTILRKINGFSEYSGGEFIGEFRIEGLVATLRDRVRERGINIPEGSGIEYINDTILTDRGLYRDYPRVKKTRKDLDRIAHINDLFEDELMRFNRSLIDRGNPQESPKNRGNLGDWTAWTHVVVDNQDHRNIKIYRDIQKTFRRHVQEMLGRFASVIELEQLLWQKY